MGSGYRVQVKIPIQLYSKPITLSCMFTPLLGTVLDFGDTSQGGQLQCTLHYNKAYFFEDGPELEPKSVLLAVSRKWTT